MGQKGAKRARAPEEATDDGNTNLGCANSATLLEAFPAENRPPLGGTEGHSGLFPTLRAIRLGFRAHRRAAAEVPFGTLRFTRFAPFGLIFEPFIGEKHLFARSEYKFGATLRTLQDLVVIFHEPLSPSPGEGRGVGALCTMGLGTWGTPLSGEAEADPLGLRARSCNRNPNDSALRGLILGSAAPSRDEEGGLVRFAPLLLAQSLPRKRFFGPALFAGFHVEAVLLDFLNDVFLLHLALKTAQGILERFTLLNNDFCHWFNSPPIRFGLDTVRCSLADCTPP